MTDDNNKNLDLFLTDIEKIQAEIACDLHKVLPEAAPEPTPAGDAVPLNDAPIFSPAPSLDAWLKADVIDEPGAFTNGFYRETIKNTKEKPKRDKWFGKAVAIFLAVTLGMGSLGFGI
ncbi:MAG: hypothetical protein FWG38_10125, partial [Defluviitaleaceae bacterium]|nr:hypothetical protein [Defluviitaleaceae bacterium]